MKNLEVTDSKNSTILHDENTDIYIRYDKVRFDVEVYDRKNDVYWEDVDQEIQDIFIKMIVDHLAIPHDEV